MPLSPDELTRRIDAARTLRGLTQAELGGRLAEDGFGKHDLGRLERKKVPFTRNLRRALADHLAVPEEWFTEPDFDAVLGLAAAGDSQVMARLDEIAAERAELASMVTRRLDALEARMTELLEAHEVLMTERWSSTEVALRQAVVVETAARLEELARRSSTPGEPPRRSATPRTAGKGAREPKS